MPQPLVMLLSRLPRPGTAKTRLAARFGATRAARFAEALLADTLSRHAPVTRSWRFELHFTPADAGDEARAFAAGTDGVLPQAEGDLGERLRHAFEGAFARGFGPVLCIGSDSPFLEPATLDLAIQKLAAVPVAIVPADDGGYCLLGLARPLPQLFDAMPWSSPDLLDATLARCQEVGVPHALLPPLRDIDRPEDIERLARELERAGTRPGLLAACAELVGAPAGRPNPSPRAATARAHAVPGDGGERRDR